MSYSSGIEPRYIPGHPSISLPDEDRADNCLILSRKLWHGSNVYYVGADSQYSQRGSLDELYVDTMRDFINASNCPWVIPRAFCIVELVCCTSIASFIPGLIGKYMKDKALERNPKAKEYNKIAVDYLETLDRPPWADRALEKLKVHQEHFKKSLDYLRGLSHLINENTKSNPQTLEGTLIADGSDWSYVITPIMNENQCVVDYGIFHTTLSEITRKIEFHEEKLKELEFDISIHEDQLKAFQNANTTFEMNVKNLINSDFDEFK